jgi:hypothetical protein
MVTFNYSAEQYGFVRMVSELFQVDALESLHIAHSDLVERGNLEWKDESSSEFHKLFYGKLSLGKENAWTEIIEAYDSFVREEISKRISGDFLVQKFPSFRVQLPNSRANNKWHYDSDKDHGHPEGEINVQIPLTVMYDTSATWIESVPGMQDFKPMNMVPGQYTIFNGNKCTHGNKSNTTGLTRVSFDFRAIRRETLEAQITRNSATLGVKFAVGGYYKEVK